MGKPMDFGRRVWAGDASTVSEARARYEVDPVTQLIPFAVILYSFRMHKSCADELLSLREKLDDEGKKLLGSQVAGSPQQSADRADVLSTILGWMSFQGSLKSSNEWRGLRLLAHDICDWGLTVLKQIPDHPSHHTYYLLKLTIIQLGYNEHPVDTLDSMAVSVERLEDANQRCRVFRKLGSMYRKYRVFDEAFYWGLRACFMRGIGRGARLKSFAALAGIER